MTPKQRKAMEQALEALDEFIVDYQGEDGMNSMKHYAKNHRAAADELRAALAEPAEQEPGNWIVYNSGAEVASGLSFAEAWGYMTPGRLARQWCAVCVVDQSNLPIAPRPAKLTEQEKLAIMQRIVDSNTGFIRNPAAPQPAKREPLTDEELGKIINANWGVGVWHMARAIEDAIWSKT